MSEIWIVLVEDRHTDVDALPFSARERAIRVARETVEANAAHPESVNWVTDLEPADPESDMVFLATYGDVNGDAVSVIKRTMDGEQDCICSLT